MLLYGVREGRPSGAKGQLGQMSGKEAVCLPRSVSRVMLSSSGTCGVLGA